VVDSAAVSPHPCPDLEAFAESLDAIRAEARRAAGPADVAHFKRIIWTGRALTLVGLATRG
jgi:hypothetical protein